MKCYRRILKIRWQQKITNDGSGSTTMETCCEECVEPMDWWLTDGWITSSTRHWWQRERHYFKSQCLPSILSKLHHNSCNSLASPHARIETRSAYRLRHNVHFHPFRVNSCLHWRVLETLPKESDSLFFWERFQYPQTARHESAAQKMQGWKLRHKLLWTAKTTFTATGDIFTLSCAKLKCMALLFNFFCRLQYQRLDLFAWCVRLISRL